MVQKLHKGLFELAEIVPIGVHVIGIDVGDHGHHRQEVEERGVGFVGLDHDVFTATQLGIGPGTVELATNHKGGV